MVSIEEGVDATNKEVILNESALIENNYGLPLSEVYKLALKYYREKEKSGELMVPYEKRLLFMAYAKQIRLGPYNDAADDSGWFDLVGNDRKLVLFVVWSLHELEVFFCDGRGERIKTEGPHD
ncbi:Golgi resident protein GCP60 [Toxocara canis]|uniref:Golgi resident protein GCP60 n=1 Tax=Toxocara canis TaxID=6265 RepID=A0A0B2VPP3_TOXCA|nr:Golgi resident protein GCP60 [Toxocara canis]